eukprot:m.122523 g.122523  ORF g.122523 m.122523 type:complete len:819 (+) comp28928_c0_seq1:2-2458(+)
MATAISVGVVGLLATIAASLPLSNPCGSGSIGERFPFCNQSLSFEERTADLVSRIPGSDVPGLLNTASGGVESLGIPATQWWSEGLHGVRCGHGVDCNQTTTTTVFPEPIFSAAAFNDSLWYSIGAAISTEFRALANAGDSYLSIFAPNINIFRDGRWGRGQETPGEDPMLSSRYAASWVQGMQGNASSKYLKTVTTCKHYAGYNLENYNAPQGAHGVADRQHFNAIITEQDMADTYLPAFRSCVREGAGASIMCSYNAVNGKASCGNFEIQETILRGQFNFSGYIVSDCGGVADVTNARYPAEKSCIENVNDSVHNAAGCLLKPNGSSATTMAMNGGCDLDCGSAFTNGITASLSRGEVTMERVNLALNRLFLTRMKLGEFDDGASQPYRNIDLNQVNSEAHQQLAIDATRQALTLLKNEDNVLPLMSSKFNSIAVIGPSANCSIKQDGKGSGICNQLGNYATAAPFTVTPADGIEKFANVTTAEGCGWDGDDMSGFTEASQLATDADATVLVIGLAIGREWQSNLESSHEGEANDRISVALPSIQLKLLDQIAASCKGKPLIVVIMSGGPVDLGPFKADKRVSALFWTGYPGMMGGQAIGEAIFGALVPSGRLPYSIYSNATMKSINSMRMDMRPDPSDGYPGRTHRFYTGKIPPVYNFGFGLQNYGQEFNYSFANTTDHELCATFAENISQVVERRRSSIASYLESFRDPSEAAYGASAGYLITDHEVIVSNPGPIGASTSVLAYLSPPGAGTQGRALRELLGFDKIWLAPGESKSVRFKAFARDLTLVNTTGERAHVAGEWVLSVGEIQASICL